MIARRPTRRDVVIVLDTHAWVFWASGSPALSRKASERIDEALGRRAVCISCISCREVALLVKRGECTRGPTIS
jgi:PIN domain nuclease of toxin-antitoxin system